MNLLNTIKNLDLVLGVDNIKTNEKIVKVKPNISKIVKKSSNYTIKKTDKPFNYIQYAEIVNGRCAIAGQIEAYTKYKLSGLYLLDQITTDPTNFSIQFIGTVALISFISRMTIDKYDIKNLPENLEDVASKFVMMNWMFILFMINNQI